MESYHSGVPFPQGQPGSVPSRQVLSVSADQYHISPGGIRHDIAILRLEAWRPIITHRDATETKFLKL
jgi:hypothetical protein